MLNHGCFATPRLEGGTKKERKGGFFMEGVGGEEQGGGWSLRLSRKMPKISSKIAINNCCIILQTFPRKRLQKNALDFNKTLVKNFAILKVTLIYILFFHVNHISYQEEHRFCFVPSRLDVFFTKHTNAWQNCFHEKAVAMHMHGVLLLIDSRTQGQESNAIY